MRLQSRLLLVVGLVFAASAAALAYHQYRTIRREVAREALAKARVVRGITMAVRRVYQRQFLRSGLPLNERTVGFLPAFAMGHIAEEFAHWDDSGLVFNNVSDRPRNPRNRADAIEMRAIRYFRDNPVEEEWIAWYRDEQGRAWLHYARPIRIEEQCLKCHGRRADAPPGIRDRYDTAYDYGVGDLRGILSVKVPAQRLESEVLARLGDVLWVLLPALAAGFLGLGLVLHRSVVHPVGRLHAMACLLEQGHLEARSTPSGAPELRELAEAMNRMAERIRRRDEEARLHRDLYRALSETNELLLRMEAPEKVYEALCRIVVTHGHFALAWIGIVQSDGEVLPVSGYGEARAYLERIRVHTGAARPEGQGAVGTAIREDRPVVIDDLQTNPRTRPWHEAARRFGLAAIGAFPIRRGNRAVGALAVYATRPGFFSSEVRRLLEELAANISFALENFERECERREARSKVEYLAYHDPLTELPNRLLLRERLAQAVAAARRHRHKGAVLFLDLDHFKHINDSLGHAVGDRLLGRVAHALRTVLRTEDTLARVGGDEFVIVLPRLRPVRTEAAAEVQTVAEKLQTALDRPFTVESHELNVGCSIGIVLFPDDGDEPDELLRHADTALYRAKAEGRGNVRFFLPAMQRAADRRLALERDLRATVARGGFELHYQPQVEVAGSTVTGVEALLRWRHADRGLVPAGEFIPVLEEIGLMHRVGRWVLGEACARIAAWRGTPYGHLAREVAVNISPRQFQQPDFVGCVRRTLEQTGADPSRLTLELTEGVLIEDLDEAVAKIGALRELGVRLALDDFGTGYASLAYLKRLQMDVLKIDRSFIDGIPGDADDVALVETILHIGRRFGMRLVAEGVETEAQLHFLRERGCDAYQGLLFSPPLPESELGRFARG